MFLLVCLKMDFVLIAKNVDGKLSIMIFSTVLIVRANSMWLEQKVDWTHYMTNLIIMHSRKTKKWARK